ncbi:MAG TPA: DNA topoisomerase IB, partial [Terrimesophilobacter sp.]|nr:DNA topoisomerase IB [Terrimesophilobacter sp.]
TLNFPGKSGVEWSATVSDPDLATVIRSLKQRGPRARLLAHQDGSEWRSLTPTDVNDYVRDRVGDGFTSKDFRTLHGTIIAARHLATAPTATSETARRRVITAAVRAAADTLGNTPAIARGSYIDPRIIDRYRAGDTLRTDVAPESALRELLD